MVFHNTRESSTWFITVAWASDWYAVPFSQRCATLHNPNSQEPGGYPEYLENTVSKILRPGMINFTSVLLVLILSLYRRTHYDGLVNQQCLVFAAMLILFHDRRRRLTNPR
jgi:hypothetical protein